MNLETQRIDKGERKTRGIHQFHKVVVANRGDVARRAIRALRTLGIRSVAVYSEADAGAPYLAEADEAYLIGEAQAQASYLNQDALLKVLKDTGADGVHPGYGFLSENTEFAARVENAGARFIGPAPRWIDAMSHKSQARELMAKYGMPIGLGSGILSDVQEEIIAQGRQIGFPVLVKPAGGGGGIGMLPAHDEEELLKVVERARSLAFRSFSNNQVYLEKYMVQPRHIEFQILGDQHGGVQHLFERDCSVQRRHQKIIEEAPAPAVDRKEIDGLAQQITKVLQDIGYDNIGTVEMLRGSDGSYSFLEMNTRLQVEHAVTEEITGVDLVVAQIRSAAGERLSNILPANIERNGHAIEVRVYAEDPKNFFPSPGKLNTFRTPSGNGIRVETGYAEGMTVTPYYDPMIAKVIAHAENREKTIEILTESLKEFDVSGIKTNIPFLLKSLASEQFRAGEVHTGLSSTILSS
ncbi:acetyl-CoA carboxylase biotin carboxylase subunit [Cytobacillus depressus]|uniref:acetyl-CoA carboxylase biotin carboxylase subunit n=1 Tax=Cytobacillus depressus TaxID=1602942 RepID=UPI001FEB9E74|nr:biotin carboxylase N-terminal domain-containing protein [Cytobacillus depressus]